MNYLSLPTCITYSLRSADRILSVWAFFTQPQAIKTYRWLALMAGYLLQLIIWSSIWAYAQVQKRIEPQQVELNSESMSCYFETMEEMLQAINADYYTTISEPDFYDEAQPYTDDLPAMWEPSDFIGGMTDSEYIKVSDGSPIDEDYVRPQAQTMNPAIAICTIPVQVQIETANRHVELHEMTLAQLKPIAEKHNLPTRKVRKADLVDSILKAEDYGV